MKTNESTANPAPVITLVPRSLANDPFGRTKCWDLIVEDCEGRCLLPDIATDNMLALKIFTIFKDNEVGSVNAESVMEDLLCDCAMLDCTTKE